MLTFPINTQVFLVVSVRVFSNRAIFNTPRHTKLSILLQLVSILDGPDTYFHWQFVPLSVIRFRNPSSTETISVILILRVHAMYGRARYLLWGLLLLLFLPSSVLNVNCSISHHARHLGR